MRQEQVLVIDDNSYLCYAIATLLEDEGYCVSTCYDGKAGIELLKETKFDIVLVDFNMPELTGDQVTAEIRKLSPNIFIVGFSVASKMQEFLSAGADTFIYKDNLIKNLLSVLSQRSAEDAGSCLSQ